uniref:Uncharacterized protein n=1 Tax=Strongyloides papillosus TaxID=174720 RepID=A0A0N5C8Q8_STREA
MLICTWESLSIFSCIKFYWWIFSVGVGFLITCSGRRTFGNNSDAKFGNFDKEFLPNNDDVLKKPKTNSQLYDDEIHMRRKKSSNNDDNDGPPNVSPKGNRNFENELDMTQTPPDNDSDECSDKNRSNKNYSSKREKNKLKTCLKSPNTASDDSISHKKVSFNEKVKIRVVESEDMPSLRSSNDSDGHKRKSKSSIKLNRLRMKKKDNFV